MIDRRMALVGGVALAGLAASRVAAADRGIANLAYDRAIVIDGLGGFNDPYGPEDEKQISTRGAAELRQSGTTAVHFTVNEVGNEPGAWEKTVGNIAQLDQLIADNADVLLRALSTGDFRAAKASNRLAVYYGVQDTSLVGTELDRLALLKGLGVRIVQLTYNLRNLSGDGSLEPANAGLSKLGHDTIARIEHEKLLLDLSHGGQRTIAEALAAATRPPIISHTGCRALNDNPRNVWDAEMRTCADKGGVIGIYWMPFLVPNSRPTGADVVAHMTHVRDICGEDHVAIGTDGIIAKTVIDEKARATQRKFFQDRSKRGIAAPGEGSDIFNIVAEWDDAMRFRHLADGLSRARWTTRQIEKALGANLLRLYGDVWGT
ncbi:MAG TPA: membrane dipeptidase [Allosphingosinicella sp.]|jgi:membrane dipeptidase